MSADAFAAVGFALLVAHNLADHWVQTDHQAKHKGAPGWVGRWSCAKHVGTYTLTTAAFVGLTWWLLGLHVSWLGFVLGQAVSAITHYWADRRTTLRWLAKLRGAENFYNLGAPREGRDDNPSLGTGAYALDQSFHWVWLFAAALLTALVGA